MLIRRMTAEDAQHVAEVHVQSWKYAYRGIVPQSYLDSLDVQKRTEIWRQAILSNQPLLVRLVAEHEGRVVGFICGLENRNREKIPLSDSELWAIYVDPDQSRIGVGKKLLDQFKFELKQLGKTRFCVWVLKDNRIGRNFYEKHRGMTSSATSEIVIDSQPCVEVAYEFIL